MGGSGLPSQLWIPPLYLRLFGPHPPEAVETAILLHFGEWFRGRG